MVRFVLCFLILSLICLGGCAVRPGLPEAPSPAPTGPAAVWERTGGIAGICHRLTIQMDGAYTLFDCAANRELRAGALSSDQLNQLRALLSQYPTHQNKILPPAGSADMFTESYTLYGQGAVVPSPQEQMKISEFFAGLAASLAPVPAG